MSLHQGDYFVRLTSTGLVIFGQVLPVPEGLKEFFVKRPDLLRVKNYSTVNPKGAEVNEYQRALTGITAKMFAVCKQKGWKATPEVREVIAKWLGVDEIKEGDGLLRPP